MSCIKGKSVDESASILCLNDDCLENVFKYLEIKDQVNLASSCMRFRDVFDMFSRIKYQTVFLEDIEFHLTSIELHKFFEIAGPNIKNFKLYLWYQLTSMQLQQLPTMTKRNRKDFKSHLQHIWTTNICELLGNSIKDLINIEELDLTGTHITCIAFTDICENLKELKILHITEISQLEKSSLMEAIEHLIKLETLHIDGSIKYIECFAQIPNLIELWINGASEDFFEVLGKYQKNQLQKLIIDRSCMTPKMALFIGQLEKLETLHCHRAGFPDQCLNEFAKLINLKKIDLSGCGYFENEDLLNLIKSCRRLQWININECMQISNSFAKDVLKLLVNRQSQPGGILHISAFHSGINRSFVNTSEFESANALLKIDCPDYEEQIEQLEKAINEFKNKHVQ